MLVPYLRSLFMHSTCTSWHIFRGSCILGGGSFQGEWPPWVLVTHTWWVPLSTRGRVLTHLPLHLGVSGVRNWKFLLVTGVAECALIWLSIAYCEGMHFGLSGSSVLSFCLLLYRLCRALASFWRNRCFAFTWLRRASPLSWGVMF